jgi:hypothetical protein
VRRAWLFAPKVVDAAASLEDLLTSKTTVKQWLASGHSAEMLTSKGATFDTLIEMSVRPLDLPLFVGQVQATVSGMYRWKRSARELLALGVDTLVGVGITADMLLDSAGLSVAEARAAKFGADAWVSRLGASPDFASRIHPG